MTLKPNECKLNLNEKELNLLKTKCQKEIDEFLVKNYNGHEIFFYLRDVIFENVSVNNFTWKIVEAIFEDYKKNEWYTKIIYEGGNWIIYMSENPIIQKNKSPYIT